MNPAEARDWFLMSVGPRQYLGKLTHTSDGPIPDRVALGPVYGFREGVSKDGSLMRDAHPLYFSAKASRLVVRWDSAVPLSEFTEPEIRSFATLVKRAEEQRDQIRASQNGIVLAPNGVKLPPPPGEVVR